MNVNFADHAEAARKREYNFRCKVERKKVSFVDSAYEGNSEAELVVLLPYEGTERDMFMAAWYALATPRPNGEGHMTSKVELPAFVGSPVSMPTMIRVQHPNEYCDKPHLLVMTVAIEKLLVTYKDVKTIELRVFPEDKMDELGLSDGIVRI